MKLYDISKDALLTTPYEGDPKPQLRLFETIDNNGCNVSAVRMSVHAGSHVDAPLHYIKNGADITELSVDHFIGPCSVITVPRRDLDAMFFMNLKIHQRLILRGNGVLTTSGIGYLYNSGIKLVGTDRDTIATYEDEFTVHNALLGYGIPVLENLDLSQVPDGEYLLSAAPIRISGAEAAPCRAVLIAGLY